MQLHRNAAPDLLGAEAAKLTAKYINEAIKNKGAARIIFSTGASQFDTIKHLLNEKIDWSKVTGFHLDEYLGLPDTHPASFVRYLRERLVNKAPFKHFYFIDGAKDAKEIITAVTAALREAPIDAALIGIGENGHIAFNDPPCDIVTKEAYHLVTLDEKCRNQQVREGWYKAIEEVPKQAISMTVNEILKAKAIISAVPYAVKAEAVYNTLNQKTSPMYPCTYLMGHRDFHLFVDKESASKI